MREKERNTKKVTRFYLSSKAQEVFQIIEIEADKDREIAKFRYLVRDLDYSVSLQSETQYAGMDLSRSRGLKFPLFKVNQWMELEENCKSQIAVYINLLLEELCSLQTFIIVITAILKDTDLNAKILAGLKQHHLLGFGLILEENIKESGIFTDENSPFTFMDLAVNFYLFKTRSDASSQVDPTLQPNPKTSLLCQFGLRIADQLELNYSNEPRFHRGKGTQLKSLFATMRLFAGEDSKILSDKKEMVTGMLPDRVYENTGRNGSLERKPPSGKRSKGKISSSQRGGEESRGPIQIFSAENLPGPQFILCTDAQVMAQPGTDWRSLQTPPDMIPFQSNESKVDASYQAPSVVTEKEEFLSQLSGASTPIPPRFRDSMQAGEAQEGKKDGTFLTSIGIAGPQRQVVPRSLSTTTLTSRPSMLSGAKKKWRPVDSKVLYVVTAPMPVTSYNYYESHKDLLPALPKRKVYRPKMAIVGKQAGIRSQGSCDSAEEHLTRVYNRDFTPWVPYQLYPRFKVRKDQFCVNYGEILVKDYLEPEPQAKS